MRFPRWLNDFLRLPAPSFFTENDPGLATRFMGEPSPFPDMAPTHPAFNAAMVCVTRGFFDTDARTGAFDPMGPLPGATAVLAINRLVEELSVF